jgi:hypothetical protein
MLQMLKVGEEKVIEEVNGVFHVAIGRVMALWIRLIVVLRNDGNNEYYYLFW